MGIVEHVRPSAGKFRSIPDLDPALSYSGASPSLGCAQHSGPCFADAVFSLNDGSRKGLQKTYSLCAYHDLASVMQPHRNGGLRRTSPSNSVTGMSAASRRHAATRVVQLFPGPPLSPSKSTSGPDLQALCTRRSLVIILKFPDGSKGGCDRGLCRPFGRLAA